MNTYMTGSRFRFSFFNNPCALDKSNLSIGRVNIYIVPKDFFLSFCHLESRGSHETKEDGEV